MICEHEKSVIMTNIVQGINSYALHNVSPEQLSKFESYLKDYILKNKTIDKVIVSMIFERKTKQIEMIFSITKQEISFILNYSLDVRKII